MKILTAFILFIAVSCSNGIFETKSDNENFIQGKWHISGNVPGDRNLSWFLEWEFSDGKFIQNGYPPILQKGKYKVISDKESKLKLKLYDQKGTWGEDDSEVEIIINRESKLLTIQGKSGFKKLNKSGTK